MSAGPPTPRPAAIWAATIVSALAFAWGVQVALAYIERGELYRLTPVPLGIALVIGLVGFWLLRWWGVLIAVVGAAYICVLSLLWHTSIGWLTMAGYGLPVIIAALAYRQRFKW